MRTMKGILDRFEGEQAVILIDEEQTEVIVNANELPSGSKRNTMFKMEKVNGAYKIVGIDVQATKQAETKSSSLMDQLRAKSKGSKFKR